MSVHNTAPPDASRRRWARRPAPFAVMASVAATAALSRSGAQGLVVGVALLLVLVATTPAVRRRLGGGGAAAAGPLDALSDRDLLGRWTRSGDALERSTERPEHALRIVSRRSVLLDEIERRGLAHRCRP